MAQEKNKIKYDDKELNTGKRPPTKLELKQEHKFVSPKDHKQMEDMLKQFKDRLEKRSGQ